MLHSNTPPYAVPKWSLTRSVLAICPCIQHHRYAFNVWLICLFFTCSSRVNIEEPAIWFTVSLFTAVSRVRLPSILISTAMSNTQSLNTSLLEVIISSKYEPVFIRDLSDHTLQIIFDGCWASMNVGSKRHIAWNNSTHPPSWLFYLHCGNEEAGRPGILCILPHQVLRHPSEHGTSSMGKHLLAKAHIAKLSELTESEVTELTSSMVDETALAIRKRQGSCGITIVWVQKKIIFGFQFNQYWPKCQIKRSKLAAKDFETLELHEDMRNRYLM